MKTNRTSTIQILGQWGLVLTLTAFIAGGRAFAATDATEYPDFYRGDNAPKDTSIDWVQAIQVTSPAPCTDIRGNVTVNFKAPGMTTVKASCWQQPVVGDPNPWGHDTDVAKAIKLDAQGNGSFVFPADQYPNGPLIIRIYAKDDGKKQDVYQLQVYNQGGVVWNQGIPMKDPPGAQGMKLVFSDDFNGSVSISPDGKGAKYAGHKTGGGDFSGWPFTDNKSPGNPFSREGTFLRIHASKKPGNNGSSGIISSLRSDLTGVAVKAPSYFECRFLAQSAPGTWPAFWLLNKGSVSKTTKGCDELDIIEAYGGVGPRNPNFPGYAVTSHYWNQVGPNGLQKKDDHVDVPVMDLGGKSSWSTTFHTYAVKITKTDTIYYFDDIEVLRHPTSEISKTDPMWFLVNYSIGGISGWHIDLERYGNVSDMWVDYVRVYHGDN